MKILRKRAFAFTIDIFAYCALLASLLDYVCVIIPIRDLAVILSFLPFFLLDCIFGNGSPAKKLYGISIYNTAWEKPSLLMVIRRSFCMYFVSVFAPYRIMFGDWSLYTLFEWERNVLKTFTIDKKVYKELKAHAEKMDGKFEKNMTELYMMYLRDIYHKDKHS